MSDEEPPSGFELDKIALRVKEGPVRRWEPMLPLWRRMPDCWPEALLDMDAAAEVLGAIELLLWKKVQRICRWDTRCRCQVEDLFTEAKLAAIDHLCRYDGRCRVTTYVGNGVFLAIQRPAKAMRTMVSIPQSHWHLAQYKNSAAFKRAVNRQIFQVHTFPRDDDQHYEPADKRPPFDDRLFEINEHLDKLSTRERDIIIRRFGLNGRKPEMLREVSHRLGITRERVRQIENIALRKMHDPRVKPTTGRKTRT